MTRRASPRMTLLRERPPLPDRRTDRLAEQRRRVAELDAIRIDRRLTGEEQAEADRLTQRLYMRVYRQRQRERFGPGAAS